MYRKFRENSYKNAGLMADIIQYFNDRNIKFEPSSIYEDVIKAKDYVHGSGILHNTIIQNLPEYLNR
jgi:hypothetical protein